MKRNVKKYWSYNIEDIVYYNNSYIHEYNLGEKINLISTILKTEYVYDDFINCCYIQLCSYFTLDHLNLVEKDCNVLFVPKFFNQINYYTTILTKKKEIILDKNDKDFIVKKTETPDVYLIYKDDKMIDNLGVIGMDMSLKLRNMFFDKNECKILLTFSDYFNKWIIKE